MRGLICEHYRLTEKLGEGGIAEVWIAEHVKIGQKVAIKLLLPHISAQQEFERRFLKEAKAVAAITHPGIIQIYGYGNSNDGRAYISMEYLQGESLATCIQREGQLSFERTKRLIRQLASALEAAHEQKIWHRDLKPDNLFLISDPEIEGGERLKVLDFGLAKLTVEYAESTATVPGSIFGTPAYMAPEQCLDAGSVDGRADLYSIGCIFYRLLCGRGLFEASEHLALLQAQLKQMPEPPQHYRPDIPAHINSLIMRLLAKSPDERVQSCSELLAELDGSAVPRIVPLMDSGSVKTLIFKGGLQRMALPGIAHRASDHDEVTIQPQVRPDWLEREREGAPGMVTESAEHANAVHTAHPHQVAQVMAPRPVEQRGAVAAGAGTPGSHSANRADWRGSHLATSNSSISGSAGELYRRGYRAVQSPQPIRRRTWILTLFLTSAGLASIPVFDCLPHEDEGGYAVTSSSTKQLDGGRSEESRDGDVVADAESGAENSSGRLVLTQHKIKSLITQARLANQEKRYQDAARACNQVLKAKRDHMEAHILCAHAACASGHLDVAREHARVARDEALVRLRALCPPSIFAEAGEKGQRGADTTAGARE